MTKETMMAAEVRVPEREEVFEAWLRVDRARSALTTAELEHFKLAEARYGKRPIHVGPTSAELQMDIDELRRALREVAPDHPLAQDER